MLKRGQAAMEFLMTYGWAILAVLISLAALAYFGVLSPARFLPESCTFFPGLACTDVVVGKNAAVITVQNGLGSNLNNFQVSIASLGCSSTPTTLADGQKVTIAIVGCSISGKSIREDLKIQYSSGSLSHTRSGKLAAEVGKGNMVLYYSFEPGTIAGSTVNDLSGFGNDGSITGADCTVSGKYGNGCLFDIGKFVNAGNDISFDTNVFSIEFWIKPLSLHAGDANNNIIMGRENYLISGFRSGLATSGQVQFWATQSGGTLNVNSGATLLNIGTFYHIVVTYDGSKGNLYIDSNSVGSMTGTYNIPVGFNLVVNGGIGGTTFSNSIIDEVRIYNYVIR